MLEAPDTTRPSRAGAFLLRRGVALLLVLVFAGLVLFRGGSIWWRHDEVVHGGRAQAEQVAHILSEHLQQTVATIDATFKHLVAHSFQVGGPGATPEDWSNVLIAAISGLKAVERLSVIDRDGVVRHATQPAVIGAWRGDHPLFQALADAGGDGLAARGSFRDPGAGRLMVPLARRLVSLSGDFDGIVTALLDPARLGEFYREIDFGPRAVVSIFTRDGELLYRHGAAGDLAPLLAAIRDLNLVPQAHHDARAHTLRAPIDRGGESYFTVLCPVSNAPLIVAVSLAEAEVLGSWRDELRLSVFVLGTVALLFVVGGGLVARELRARAAAGAALKRNQARFHEIMYRAPVLVSVKDAEGRVQFVNKALEDLFGIDLKEAAGRRLAELPAMRNGPVELISSLDQEVIDSRAPIQRELTYFSRGAMRTAMIVKYPLFDGDGNIDSIASFSVDLTEQRRAAKWFNTIMDHAPAMIALKDVEGRFIFANRAQADAAGLSVRDFLGRRADELFEPGYAAQHEQFDRDVIAARAPIQREFTAPYATGTRTLLVLKFPIFDAGGNIESIGAIATDISSQKQAEMQLAHAQRMEAMGQLTGGIAHDFNNLLTVMIGNSELLASELGGDERLAPLARLTLEAAERSAALTQRLLAFGRRQMLEPRSTDVRRLLEDMESLYRRAAGARVHAQLCCAEDELWPAMVDPGQLETAIINLVVNSRDAMPDGGRIVIELANAGIDESYVALNPDARPGDYVMVAVSDTGTGMPPEVVARIFEPFFTTKEAGKGTGLGLPTVYGFVKQSGGHIKIYSEVGHGTVVRLYFPRAGAPGIVPDLHADAPDRLPRGRESILLVEDDRIVRDHTEGQLCGLGYRVTAAASPDEALKLSRLTGRPDLLVTDVVMAGSINGRQLAERMRERWPDVKVLFVSGYTDGVLPALVDGLADGMHFLAKPFRRRDLAVKVREALDAGSAAAAAPDRDEATAR